MCFAFKKGIWPHGKIYHRIQFKQAKLAAAPAAHLKIWGRHPLGFPIDVFPLAVQERRFSLRGVLGVGNEVRKAVTAQYRAPVVRVGEMREQFDAAHIVAH